MSHTHRIVTRSIILQSNAITIDFRRYDDADREVGVIQ